MNRKQTFFCIVLFLIGLLSAGVSAQGEKEVTLQSFFGVEDPSLIQPLDLEPVDASDIEITLNEVALEADHVHFLLTVKSDKIKTMTTLQLGLVEKGLTIGDETFDLIQNWEHPAYYLLDDDISGSVPIVLSAEVPLGLLDADEIPMTLRISEVHYQDGTPGMTPKIEGPWVFEFIADGSKIRENTRTIPLNHAFILDGTPYRVRMLTVTPLKTQIDTVKYTDERGRLTYPYVSDNLLGFVLSDEKGNEIQVREEMSESWEDDDAWVDLTFTTDRENNGWDWIKNAETLTITPYGATADAPDSDKKGIARFTAMDPLTVEINPKATALETFMSEFEPEYEIWNSFDSKSPYASSVRLQQTTPNGTVLLLDKVIVMEDTLAVSFLVGSDRLNEEQDSLMGFEIGMSRIEAGPVLPYPDDFELSEVFVGGGGGEPTVNAVNREPLVVANLSTTNLMTRDGYVSVKDPIQVRVTVDSVSTCWSDTESYVYSTWNCFDDEGPFVFEFETDGAALAKLTKEIEIGRTLTIQDTEVTLKSLRFNPLQPIIFTSLNPEISKYGSPGLEVPGLTTFLEADDGTAIILQPVDVPFYGLSTWVVNKKINQSFIDTSSVKLSFCFQKTFDEFPADFDPFDKRFYDCDPDLEVDIPVK